MNKCYTIIAFFSVGDYTEKDECWIAHFNNKEDAIKCLKLKMEECNDSCNVEETFDDLVNCGHNYTTDDGTMFFVRNEEVQIGFNEEKNSWK